MLANDSPYGLSSYLFTNDYRVAMEAEARLDFGELYINRSLGEAMQAHHSGHRQSGSRRRRRKAGRPAIHATQVGLPQLRG
jgi:acyl-CoA reductase-like NAD-dependent aldehyde dehydrogenase